MVDVDDTVEDDQRKLVFILDKEKASLQRSQHAADRLNRPIGAAKATSRVKRR